MPITIGSNIASLRGIRAFNSVTKELQTSLERLSSGLHINKASDDAAGLAIADLTSFDSRIAKQGARNLNDGISFFNVIDSTLGDLSNIVIRLQELSSQSANGAYSTVQRIALDKEGQALRDEYIRIREIAAFNGINYVNDIGDEGILLQGGYGTNGGLRIQLLPTDLAGTGAFQNQITTATGSQPDAIAAADINGDGIADIVTGGSTDNMEIYLGNGDGTFQGRLTVANGSRIAYIEIADFNNDGRMDVLTSDIDTLLTSIYLGNGDGTLQAKNSYFITNSPVARAFDFNRDGNLDVVSAHPLGSVLRVRLGNGDGTLQEVASYAVGGSPREANAADFNNDGILDLFTANNSDNVANVLIGNGNGTFKASVAYAVGDSPQDTEAADFNGDGNLDIVTSNTADGTVSVLFGNGDGTFSAQSTFATGSNPSVGTPVDFNADGFKDIITADGSSNTLSLLLGNGDGTFKSRTTIAVGNVPGSVIAIDINGDGVEDLITSNLLSNTFSVNIANTIEVDRSIPSLQTFSLLSRSSSLSALNLFEEQLTKLSNTRALIGSYQSRLGVAINVLQTQSIDLDSASSQIRDADIATESAKLARLKVLQQAATSTLAQANLEPNLARDLLKF